MKKQIYYLSITLLLYCISLALGETEYYAILMDGQKVGHAKMIRTVKGNRVNTSEEAIITVSRGPISITVTTKELAIETLDGEPVGFASSQVMSGMEMKVLGKIVGDKAQVKITSAGTEKNKTIDWPEGALLFEGMNLLTKKMGLQEGTTYSAKVFSSQVMSPIDVDIRIGAKKEVDLLGRVVNLTEVSSTMVIPPAGRIESKVYVDDDCRALKQIIPMMGMNIEMVACEKEFALSEDQVVDVINKSFIKSPVDVRGIYDAKSAVYQIEALPGSKNLIIPSTDNQKTTKLSPGVFEVKVEPVVPARDVGGGYKGSDEHVLEMLKANRYVQSDDERIIKLAKKAVGNEKDVYKQAKKIEAFVASYLDQKGLSVGYATAVEVAETRKGDCSEFAVLTTALCRAMGIPARVAMGVAYVDAFIGFTRGFGGHAWVQVYIDGKWIDIDAAFTSGGRGGYGPGHITLTYGNGNPEGFFDLINSMGKFRITNITLTK